MNDYTNFEVEDFLLDDHFINWVQRPDNSLDAFWNTWIVANPAQKQKVEMAMAAIKVFNYKEPVVDPAFYTSLKNDIDTTIADGTSIGKPSIVRGLSWMKVAAALIVICVSSALLYLYFQRDNTITLSTTYAEVKTFELPDHSTVTLNANSSLEYPEKWKDDVREVTLKGEGFFRIKHIENEKGAYKFTVLANDVRIEVLGTEFNVRNRDSITSVMLESGKVQLRIVESNLTHVMNPNDFIAFNSTNKNVEQKVVNPTYYTAWLNHKYAFAKTTLKEVCDHLHNYYGLDFIINNTALANQEITGTLLLGDEQSLLQTLGSILNANITQHEKQITISSK